MVRKRRPSIASSTVALSVAALVAAATALPFQIPAYAGSRVRCGDVLTKDTSLDSDLIDCPGDGLIIGADGITVRLNDHEINAASLGTVGIRNVGHDDVTIIGGVDSTDVNISGFGIGVLINDADRNEVSGGLGADDGKYGIAVIDSDQSA